MKIAGIIVGFIGAGLFIWHSIAVLMGTDLDNLIGTQLEMGYMRHGFLSLIGGVIMFAGTWLYVAGRRKPRP